MKEKPKGFHTLLLLELKNVEHVCLLCFLLIITIQNRYKLFLFIHRYLLHHNSDVKISVLLGISCDLNLFSHHTVLLLHKNGII